MIPGVKSRRIKSSKITFLIRRSLIKRTRCLIVIFRVSRLPPTFHPSIQRDRLLRKMEKWTNSLRLWLVLVLLLKPCKNNSQRQRDLDHQQAPESRYQDQFRVTGANRWITFEASVRCSTKYSRVVRFSGMTVITLFLQRQVKRSP